MVAGLPHIVIIIINHRALNESLSITTDPHMLCFLKLPDLPLFSVQMPSDCFKKPSTFPVLVLQLLPKKIAKQMKLC